MIYLEQVTPLAQTLIDSAQLDETGNYKLELCDVDRTPALYNLVCNGDKIPLFLQGGEAAVQFLSGKPELWEEDGVLTMSMPGETVEELCGLLRPHAGEYPLTGYPLTVELIPTQIRDAQGNILREIG